MANIDTGLGWSAAENWLANAPVSIGALETAGGGMVDTGLGWSAKADYLQTAPQTYLTITWNGGSRSYSKASGGYAICARVLRRDWSGLAIISTVEDNAKGFDTYDSTPRAPGTFTYKGLTWYSYYEVPMQGRPTNYTLSGSAITVEIYDDYGMTDADVLKYVIDVATAGFEVVNTGYGWAARSFWLQNQSDITLAEVLSTPYGNRLVKKSRPGYTIAVAIDSSDWCGVLTISTDAMAVMQSVNGQDSGSYATFEYLGYTWTWADGYMFNTYGYSGVRQLNIPRYTIYGNYGRYAADREPCIKRIIDTAGVTAQSATRYSKSSNGYSVTCMCKWITSYGGNIYCSPVLISSEPNNTLYTRNSTAPSVNNTEHQYQGKTFYMRKAPLDTLSDAETITSSYPVVDLSGVAQTNDTIFAAIAFRSGLTVGETDPYSGAGESEPGAEEATFDFDSTEIDFGTPPTVTAAGMVEVYIPSTTDLASLAQYLWAGSFDPDNFKKLFADPMDAIIGLQIVPVTATEIGTTPDTLYVGNISTGLSMPKASRQYVPVNCGSLTIPRRLGSYLDYSPHTEMQLYLPYIGFVDISPDDCMGGTVSVKYMVDIIGGTCVAQVKCNNHVLYEYAAACSCQVPVSAGQYQNIVLGAVRGGVGLVSGILGAAGGGLLSGLSEAADAAMSMTKPKIQRSGGFGGSSGLMGHQTPYIIYTVPRLIVPGRQNNFIGYPSYITRTLGDLTGFTQIDSIHLSGIPASQSEQAEIEQLLQEGVYL